MKTLYDVVARGEMLTESQRESAERLFCARCQEKTRRAFRRCIRYPGSIELCGILHRVHIEGEKVSYCAGQSYPDEVRTVRQVISGH